MIKYEIELAKFKKCYSDGCERPAIVRGLCQKHYDSFRRTGQIGLAVRERKICSVEGCEFGASGRGYCKKHYMRWKKHGDPSIVLQTNKKVFHGCLVPWCDKKHFAGGYCSKHYKQIERGGVIKLQVKECLLESCDNAEYKNGLCRKHYSAERRRIRKAMSCAINGCNEKYRAKGFCHKHYQRFKLRGTAADPDYINSGKTCNVNGCDLPAYSKGMCKRHYSRFRRRLADERTYQTGCDFELVGHTCLIKMYDRNGKLAETAIIDRDDYDKVKHHTFYVDRKGYPRQSGVENRVKTIATCIMGEVGKDYVIDHSDRDPMNNRRYNLRKATISQNAANAGKYKIPTSSIYRGVSWHSKKGKWRTDITKDGKSYYLGQYSNEKEAARAYNRKAVELFGEFAGINNGI